MSLPDQFRFVVENALNQNIQANDLIIKYRGKYFDFGVLKFESESADVLGQTSTFTRDTFLAGSTIDNAAKSNPIIEMDVFIDFLNGYTTPPTNGNLNFYLQEATADTAVWTNPNTEGRRNPELFLSIDFNEIGQLRKQFVVTVV